MNCLKSCVLIALVSAVALCSPSLSADSSELSDRDHWSFRTPVHVPPPQVEHAVWVRNAIDRFILAKIEAEGLLPSERADAHTMVRRVSLELIGLPPSISVTDSVVNDSRPDAYERYVDRLFASPHYGERWARIWLDLARYADTNGYEKDRPRSIWPYRDWVIAALNADMPFSQFTVEQIAGDMLPAASLSQKIATGFHRNTMLNQEGGIDPEEDRFQRIVDRVGTTGTTWLGLTIACAQCHAHKYDPFTQREFYQLFALMNNADEVKLSLPHAGVAAQQAAIEQQVEELKSEWKDNFPLSPGDPTGGAQLPVVQRRQDHLDQQFSMWREKAAAQARHWTILQPHSFHSNAATLTALEDASLLVSGDATKRDAFEVKYKLQLPGITAMRLELMLHPTLPGGGPGREVIDKPGDLFLSQVQLSLGPDGKPNAPEKIVQMVRATGSVAKDKNTVARTIDADPRSVWTIGQEAGRDQAAVFEFKQPVAGGSASILKLVLKHFHYYPASVGRFRVSVTSDPTPSESLVVPEEIESLLLVPTVDLNEDQQASLQRYFLSVAPELAEVREAVEKVRKSQRPFPTTMVMQERLVKHTRTTYLHERGEFLKPGERVQPDLPRVLPPFPEGAPANRLGLAQWLADESNPLTARVAMNRHWAVLFGRGLVSTTEDFGTQGAAPSHPALLDWLATEFMRVGWSQKVMLRRMVTSAVYRQSSRSSPELASRDPQNLLLARLSRSRVDAEIVRDVALTTAGLLNAQLGGPSVFPPQPNEVTNFAYGRLAWKTETGANRYRRGMYTFSKRTAPYASFSVFDAPSGEACSVRRERSNTPLQALTVMNDEVFVEAAQALARRVIRKPSQNTSERMAELFRMVLTRPPAPREQNQMRAFLEDQLARFRSGQLQALVVAGGRFKRWDFAKESHAWSSAQKCDAGVSADGQLKIKIKDSDSRVTTELRAPAGQAVVRLRARFLQDAKPRLLWNSIDKPVAESESEYSNSVSFDAQPNEWKRYTVAIRSESELVSLSFEPGSDGGEVEIDWIDLSYGHLPTLDTDVAELAAWTTLARALLNLDETITKE